MQFLWLALTVTALAGDTGPKTLKLDTTLEMPGRASAATSSPSMSVEFSTTFNRPSKRIVVVGAPRQSDPLPAYGADCPCDHDNLSCNITSSGARLGWRGTAASWPLEEGFVGTCQAEHVVFPVHLSLGEPGHNPWWRGREELVTPTMSARSEDVDAKASVFQNVPEAPKEHNNAHVSCRFDGFSRQVSVKVSPDAGYGVHPCLSWDGGHVSVNLVNTER